MEIRLNALGQVIARCWEIAEEATTRVVAEKYHNPAEENITFLFSGELRAAVVEASSRHAFAHAFWADLHSEFPELDNHTLLQVSGLVARVNLHSRRHEGRRSASDLGVVITRPSVRGHHGSPQVEIVRAHARALMAQAKLNTRQELRDGRVRWRSLTRAQQRLLPIHQDYSALLLYRLEGTARSELAPFKWQTCRAHTIGEIKTWLRFGTFPHEMASADVIRGLSTGEVGTDAKSVIECFVDPPSSWPNVIEIHVNWPDGTGPPEHLRLQRKVEQKARQQVVQYVV
jgi:hypothetical protein